MAYYTFDSNTTITKDNAPINPLGNLTKSSNAPTSVVDPGTRTVNSVSINTGNVAYLSNQGKHNADTTGQYFSLPSITFASGSFSVCAWYRPTGDLTARAYDTVFKIGNSASSSTPNSYIRINHITAGTTIMMTKLNSWVGTTSSEVTVSNKYSENTWRHFCSVVGSNFATFYVDGVGHGYYLREAMYTAATADVNTIGKGQYELDYLWVGYIDEVRLYPKALSQAEVTAIYGYTSKVTTSMMFVACDTTSCTGTGVTGHCNSAGTPVCCAAGTYFPDGASGATCVMIIACDTASCTGTGVTGHCNSAGTPVCCAAGTYFPDGASGATCMPIQTVPQPVTTTSIPVTTTVSTSVLPTTTTSTHMTTSTTSSSLMITSTSQTPPQTTSPPPPPTTTFSIYITLEFPSSLPTDAEIQASVSALLGVPASWVTVIHAASRRLLGSSSVTAVVTYPSQAAAVLGLATVNSVASITVSNQAASVLSAYVAAEGQTTGVSTTALVTSDQTTAVDTTVPVTTPTPPVDSPQSLGLPAIIGIVAVAVIGAVGLGVLVYCVTVPQNTNTERQENRRRAESYLFADASIHP